jgi:hypothetical protein
MRGRNRQMTSIKPEEQPASGANPQSSCPVSQAPHDVALQPVRFLHQLPLVLYAVSLCLPAVREHGVAASGFTCLVVGFVTGIPAWFANPLFVLRVVLLACRVPVGAYLSGVVAFALGLSVFHYLQGGPSPTQGAPSPGIARIEGLRVGYFVWQASFAALTVAALVDLRTRKAAPDKACTRTDPAP